MSSSSVNFVLLYSDVFSCNYNQLSGRVLDLSLKGHWFETVCCILECKTIDPLLSTGSTAHKRFWYLLYMCRPSDFGGPRSLSHDFKIWPISLLEKGRK